MTTQVERNDEPPRIVLYLNLFRIYREALTNVLKHSKAKKVVVDLRICKGRLILSVRDNGRGWSDAAEIGKGRGLTNMKVRASEIGGTVEITADKGTCVRVDIPLSAVPV
jgi:signal transduction histidine kinase